MYMYKLIATIVITVIIIITTKLCNSSLAQYCRKFDCWLVMSSRIIVARII